MKKAIIILILSPLLFSFGSKSRKETSSAPDYIKEYNSGVQAQKNKDYDAAIQYYQNAIDQKSDFPDAWNNLGYCNRMIAKSYLEKAGDAYKKAVDYDPQNMEAVEYQGEYFLMMNQLKNAYANYQKLKRVGSKESDELKIKLDDVLKQAQSVLREYTP